MNMMSKGRRAVVRISAACVVAALAGAMLLGVQNKGISWAEGGRQVPAAAASAQDLSAAFRFASQAVMPAVVTIQTTTEPVVVSGRNMPKLPEGFDGLPEEMQPFMKRFFGDDFSRIPQQRSMPQEEKMGSGVIIDPSGIILTNNHVVSDAGKVIVHLQDSREFEASEVYTDPKTDIAVVRIEADGNLPVAEVGDSDQLEIGDWVLAVGSPFGLSETVTAGIISAKGRGLGITDREDFLQTDAAINPGNSGGPLVNVRGEVVGINTAISTRGGGNDGVGFAVPINLARWVADQLVSNGSVHRAFLGVGIQPVTSELAKQFGLKDVTGALVTEVRPDSAADAAGLQAGDAIVEFDGKQIDSPRTLQGVVEQAATGDKHHVAVIRDGKRMEIELTLKPMPESLAENAGGNTLESHSESTFESLGLELSSLTKDLAEQAGVELGSGGVLITNVQAGSPADNAGLQPGMVIRRVRQTAVADIDAFRNAVEQATGTSDNLLLLVSTSSGSRFIVLNVS
jgi:serine protease Do